MNDAYRQTSVIPHRWSATDVRPTLQRARSGGRSAQSGIPMEESYGQSTFHAVLDIQLYCIGPKFTFCYRAKS